MYFLFVSATETNGYRKAWLRMRKTRLKKAQWKQWRMLTICLLLFVLLLLTGCSSENNAESKITPTSLPEPTKVPSVVSVTPTDKAFEFQLSEMQEIYFYTVNPVTLETEAVSVVVKSDFADDPNNLMILIAESLEDAGYEVGINGAVIEGENVVVDFFSEMCPVSGLTKDEEKAVLDAIAQSLLDNLAEQNGVVFRVMGEAYESENFSFGQYYVYMKNHHK